jgi:hypothetical protein
MLAAAAAGAGHPAVAGLLGLGAAGLAGSVVAMAWSVHARQIRLAEQLARRQVVVTADAGSIPGGAPAAAFPATNGHPAGGAPAAAAGPPNGRPAGARGPDPVVIDGPDTVVAGEQVRFRVPRNGARKVVSWAVGGGSLAQAPDPAHPDELLLIADQPGDLTVTVWVREGMNERRATKPVTVVPDVAAAMPPVTLRLFLHAWGLVAVAVLIVGFAGALDALGDLASSDFIALAALLAALLGVIAVARSSADPEVRPSAGRSIPRPRAWDFTVPSDAMPVIPPVPPAARADRNSRPH